MSYNAMSYNAMSYNDLLTGNTVFSEVESQVQYLEKTFNSKIDSLKGELNDIITNNNQLLDSHIKTFDVAIKAAIKHVNDIDAKLNKFLEYYKLPWYKKLFKKLDYENL